MPHVTVGGRRLEYVWHGPPPDARPTLVFLHEGVGCVAMWRDFPAEVAAGTGCGALVYSRLGYGASDPVPLPRPLTYMHDEAKVTLPHLLDALAVKDAILVGHSDGASIALIHVGSGAAGGRVRALVLEAPHVFCEDRSLTSIAAAKQRFLEGDLRPRLLRRHGHNVDCAFWGWNDAWLDPGFRRWNIEEYLPGIRVPVLLVQAKEDPYGTRAQLDAIERGCKGRVERLELDECGHNPHKDQPDATRAAMVEFVRGIL